MKLTEAIEQYRQYVNVTKTKGTCDFYRYYLEHFDIQLGQIECEKITNKVIVDFILGVKKRSDNISNASINKYLVTLKAVVKYACGRVILFPKLKEQKRIIPTISKETTAKIFNYYQKHLSDPFAFRNYVYLKLLLDTGLRMNEMNNIQLRNIDFETSSIHIKVTKTGVDRFVCFTESTKEILVKYVLTQNIKDLLFYDFKNGNKLTTSSVESFIYRLKTRLKIEENITPHKWRHTFATTFLRNGGDLETLRLILGHSNLKTTQKYLHLSRTDIVGNYRSVMESQTSYSTR